MYREKGLPVPRPKEAVHMTCAKPSTSFSSSFFFFLFFCFFITWLFVPLPFFFLFFFPIKCHVAQNVLKLNMYQRMLLNSDPPTSTSRVWDYRCVPLQTVFEVLGIKSKSLCLSGEHCTHLMRYTTSLAPYMPGKHPTHLVKYTTSLAPYMPGKHPTYLVKYTTSIAIPFKKLKKKSCLSSSVPRVSCLH